MNAMRILLLTTLAAAPLCADRVSVPLRDPSRPAFLRVSTLNGSVHIKAHNGKEVIIETDGATPSSSLAPNGMKRIMTGMSGFTAEEENNTVTVKPGLNAGLLVIYVPEKSSVNVKTVNGKDVRVEGVDGEINADAVNGSVTLENVSGVVVAHSLNGRLTAVLRRVSEGKPMSFSTLNGRVDVTLPASTKADLLIRNDWGEVFSDFDVQLTTSTSKTEESGREGRPRYKVKVDQSVVGKINGGGAQYSFRSMNGTIYIRKGN